MNLFEIACQNSDNLKRTYSIVEERCRNQEDLSILKKFAEFIKTKWTISVNMRLFILNNFLIVATYKNIYELKREDEKKLKKIKKSGTSVEKAIEKRLKTYYKSRIIFDHTFEDGEKFKYGALTIGGLGLQNYGECCVMVEKEKARKFILLAFIKRDSLKYIDGDQVNIRQLSQDIADRECIHFLAALKHENDIKKIPTDEWASLICCNDCYIEAITTDAILSNHIASVRLSKKYYDFFSDLLYKDFISDISDEERFLLYDFKNMQELLYKQGIKLEVIKE